MYDISFIYQKDVLDIMNPFASFKHCIFVFLNQNYDQINDRLRKNDGHHRRTHSKY